MNPTYTVNGATYEPLSDHLRGWLPGALGLPCPTGANADVVQAHTRGLEDRRIHGLRSSCVSNVLWHSIRQGTCRKVEPCA